ncbi:iron-containing alcohol dehydrogenase [Levilactobacillus brevis]|uniref:Alcohol dehydrogenase, iron-dependent n=1 Tax=Levilactobacillus brevis ATCC 14869 = DSM 20054 TaxID=649758 RepID=U2NSJ7_LEVBR|nr:iron-containing alcohol dehydrogenase [Levilactobacillus brevis]ERK40980.1 alcohol dehydrogenase, iron-dependent [Levilactobacillus brevis ATCC 14869 = DSM 20054]KIO99013.1 Alcohol dehydrogenase [Levilactobacillus brevis]KRK20657.1 alcohol dehydrogenase, iron-dependent [Levilactobacillus brevis ATCC 14869 = DSM 20054]MCT3571057.1 iron-containing alcohol dehydrogenase [Levilactobacillus brevis]MCT3571967.1 iron-containing alcohol dehydrogenase [Levilactobacillus brevis]
MDVKLLQRVKVLDTDHLAQTVLEVLQTEGYQRPLFVMDSFLAQVPLVQETQALLEKSGITVSVFDQVVSDPPAQTIRDGVTAFGAAHADSLIAIGGGSSIDVARGINIVRVNGGDILDYTDTQKSIEPCPGLIAIPTTSGTGSELSNALVVTDVATEKKVAILADNAVSEYAILNPDLLLSLPKKMTIATGLDAFSHAAEGYTSRLASPVTDAICEKVMFLLYNYLPRAVENGHDREARQRVMVAAALAGWMLNNAGTNAGHSIAHILGSKYHLVHGEAVAYALPGVLEQVAPLLPHKVAEIGQILGVAYAPTDTLSERCNQAIKAYQHFRDDLVGLHPFNDYGISEEELVTNAEAVANEQFAGNTPGEMNKQVATKLLTRFGCRA